ncbi:DsbA family protein [Limisalsivibrio acetivorans]|uniref:DsbA family protein n=1 Tax=Limisalsivibrio acetivorans TaxID=1304888 RepID=UPI0003B71EF8|nr:thioredoxin domain-containing protein [Limisalsivibrio acetivorans]
MRKLALILTLALAIAACGASNDKGNEKETAAADKPVVEKKDNTASVQQQLNDNLAKFFANKQMEGVTFGAEVISAVEGLEDIKFVKITFTDTNTGKTQEQYVFSNGEYLMPDLTSVATGQGLKDTLMFMHAENVDIDTSNLSLAYGSKDAKNVIVEVSDFQCPYCRKAHEYLKQRLQGEDVAIYFMHFPLSFHEKAELYARVFEAGVQTGANFYDELYSTTKQFDKKPDEEIIEHFAAKTDNPEKFKELVNSEELKQKVLNQSKRGQELGVRGTPALFFNGKLVGGYKTDMYDKAIESFK